MSLARGERFDVDLDSVNQDENPYQDLASSMGFIGDIKERASSDTNGAAPPSLKATSTGFPAHKKRPRVSKFKAGRTGNARADNIDPAAPPPASFEDAERARIDEENRRRIAGMTAEEIYEEKADLRSQLSPALIERLLKRATIDDPSQNSFREFDDPQEPSKRTDKPVKKVNFAPEITAADTEPPSTGSASHASNEGQAHPNQTQNMGQGGHSATTPSIHFPKPPEPPDIDPSSGDFLNDLHQKYFPTLEHDPSKLAWMAPLPSEGSTADEDSPYHPSQDSVSPSNIRFSFKGAIIPPSKARKIAVTKGLHHHGEAPEAAGYTIPELAHLARSAVAGQRCIAYQTLGRLLYRLGVGEFGDETGTGQQAVLARGLWDCVEKGKVIESLEEEACKEKGHASAKAYAQEALWNWQRGGGKRMKRKAV